MGYHFGVGWLQGGFFSLDIFYVLSGYLITGLLLGESARRARIKLSAFWLRRARRLLPALLVVLVVVTLMVRFAEPAGLYPDFRMSALSALFYFSNWWQIATSSNYFVATGAVSPLTHTWSLAVEEQFYLVWPLVVLARDAPVPQVRPGDRGPARWCRWSARSPRPSRWPCSTTPGPTSPGSTSAPTPTPSRSWSARCWPASMTMVQRRRGRGDGPGGHRLAGGRVVLTVVGLAGWPAPWCSPTTLTGHRRLRLPGRVHPLRPVGRRHHRRVPCACRGGPIARVLSLRPLVWIGTVSYGAYLWHYPVFVELDAARTGLGGPGLLGRPFRRHVRPRRRQLLPGRATGHGRDVLAVAAGRSAPPRPWRCRRRWSWWWPTTAAPATAAVDRRPPRRSRGAAPGAHRQPAHSPRPGHGSSSSATRRSVTLGGRPEGPRFEVPLRGRRHRRVSWRATSTSSPPYVYGQRKGAVRVLPGLEDHFDQQVAGYRPEVVGLLMGRWDRIDQVVDGQDRLLGQPSWDGT